jgi:lipopolysaccharide assembly protein A
VNAEQPPGPAPDRSTLDAQPDADRRPDPDARTAPPPLPHHKIKRTRISGLWIAIAFFAVILLLLLIFILQNSTSVDISYLGAHGHLPLGVALLLSAVCGALLVILAGAARISQLRAVARQHRRNERPVRGGAQRAGRSGWLKDRSHIADRRRSSPRG